MRERDLLDDRQSESAAANAIGAAAAVERLEQMRQIARRDSGSAVFDGNRDAAIFGDARESQPTFPPRRGGSRSRSGSARARERRGIAVEAEMRDRRRLDRDRLLVRHPAARGDRFVDDMRRRPERAATSGATPCRHTRAPVRHLRSRCDSFTIAVPYRDTCDGSVMMPSARFCPADVSAATQRVQFVRHAGHELQLLQAQPLGRRSSQIASTVPASTARIPPVISRLCIRVCATSSSIDPR